MLHGPAQVLVVLERSEVPFAALACGLCSLPSLNLKLPEIKFAWLFPSIHGKMPIKQSLKLLVFIAHKKFKSSFPFLSGNGPNESINPCHCHYRVAVSSIGHVAWFYNEAFLHAKNTLEFFAV